MLQYVWILFLRLNNIPQHAHINFPPCYCNTTVTGTVTTGNKTTSFEILLSISFDMCLEIKLLDHTVNFIVNFLTSCYAILYSSYEFYSPNQHCTKVLDFHQILTKMCNYDFFVICLFWNNEDQTQELKHKKQGFYQLSYILVQRSFYERELQMLSPEAGGSTFVGSADCVCEETPFSCLQSLNRTLSQLPICCLSCITHYK